MRLSTLVLSAFCIFTTGAAVAQTGTDAVPNAQAGKCYAKCMIPDQYENTTEQVEVKAAAKSMSPYRHSMLFNRSKF